MPPSPDLRSPEKNPSSPPSKTRGRTGFVGSIHGGGTSLCQIEAFLPQDTWGGGGVISSDPAFHAQRDVVWYYLEKHNISYLLNDSEALKNVVRYSRKELEVACEDYSNIIGSSPDSLVYKGTLKGGHEIAVISLCIKEEHWTGYLQLYFQQEVADLARLSHENIGKFLGYCRESNPFTRMLVFEYTSNGTIYEHLHYGEGCQFSWTRRMKIIIGIARGLKYLHTELDPPFTISELNSSSVYLTEDFSSKLVDFECWKTVLSISEKSSDTISNEGAVCILPNSLERRHLNIQGNIYDFGILSLVD
ncbi:Probable LRR receptor-like serine/threonine-protein kinase [Striga hermonthica]|uniref:Probable LRR receptor-like serine/threonine-protein kinase n=1 Tax=Striga hermonthica TaxID=68872 RepID=A0A9N7MJC5_STRHE|nr:Probable LRR receptor-like serine/threonine-protein kinase [Striga hermonthica]